MAEEEKDENFLRKDCEHVTNCQRVLAEAVEKADIVSVICVLQEDLVYWAMSLKRHMFKLFNDYKGNWHNFLQNGFAPSWFGHSFVGMYEAYEMLEFHKGVEYADSFAKRFDKLLQLRNEFIEFAISYQGHSEDSGFGEFQAGVDYKRKDVKHLALSLAEYLSLLHSNFKNKVPVEGTAETESPKHEDSAERLVDFLIEEGAKITVEEIRLMYKIVIMLIQWLNGKIPDSYDTYLPMWCDLHAGISDPMERVVGWLKWNKPEIAKDLQKDYDEFLKWGWGNCEKWKDGDRKAIATGISMTRGCAVGLHEKLRHIAKLANQEEMKKSEIPVQNKIDQASLNRSQLLVFSLIGDFGKLKQLRPDTSSDFIELIEKKITLIKQDLNDKTMEQILTALHDQFKLGVDSYGNLKQKLSQCVEDIELLAGGNYIINFAIDNIVQCLQSIIDNPSTKTGQDRIYIDLNKFNKGTGSYRLLVDLLNDERRNGVDNDVKKYGKQQPKSLREVLRNNGHEDVAKKAKLRGTKIVLNIPFLHVTTEDPLKAKK